MRRFFAIFKKEFRQIGRDPLSLGLLVLVPALLLILYGYALSFDVKHIRVAVLDEDRTPASRELLDSLFQNPYFDRHRMLSKVSEADRLLDRGIVRAVLVIPRGYAGRLAKGQTASFQVLIDGADASTAGVAGGYFDLLADRATRLIRSAMMAKAGKSTSLPMVTLEPRVWFNPELESARFLVPGLIGMLLMLSAVVATSLSIVREKERQTMEQVMVSPLRPEEWVLGKTLPYVAVCIVTMALVLFLGYVLFDVRIMGSFWVLGLATLVFLMAALGMGVLISSITNSQQVAFQIAIMTSLLPSIILSGLIFPIQTMPMPIQALSFLVVPRYFVSALRAVILRGASLGAIWPELAAMLLLGLLFNLLAARNTKKSI